MSRRKMNLRGSDLRITDQVYDRRGNENISLIFMIVIKNNK